jgi:hypothetical protein
LKINHNHTAKQTLNGAGSFEVKHKNKK